nr:hypothetical protein BaRGS_011741 [Batillaria attramentaria]
MFPNLKIMSLDANPVDEQNYDLLITGGAIQQISLRHCRVTDGGAGRIGMALGTATKVNTKLLSLDLAGNLITDVGAGDLAKGLRLNRTLLTLSLANNKIEDKGAIMLAEALSRFALNHDELVERRRLIFIRECNRKASKPKAAHYCTSWTRYGRRHAIFGSLGGVRRGSAFAPDDADHEKVERSRSLSHTGLRAPSFGERDAPRGSFLAKKKTEHSPKGAKEEPKNKGHEDAGSKKGKDDTKSKGKKTPRGKKKVAVEIEVVEDEPLADSATTPGSPSRPPAVLEDMVKASGQHWASGNLVLISLNLSRNRIGEEGLWSLLKTIQYQCLTCPTSPYGDKGLLRLCLHKNKVGSDNHVLQRIDEIMRARDPTILTDPEASTGAADYPH